MRSFTFKAFPLLALVAIGCGSKSSPAGPGPAPPPACPDDAGATDPSTFSAVPTSCAYSCPLACAESTTPYACPSLEAWSCIPHASTCGSWDGTYPAVTPGQCTVSQPTGEAAAYAGVDPAHAGTRILPDGRRITPAGADWAFDEPDLQGGLTTAIIAVPGTNLVLTVDNGPGDHAVRAIDTTKIGSSNPVVSYVKFANPATLNDAITFVAPNLVLVATDDGNVQALTLDTTTGALALDATRTIKLPDPTTSSNPYWYVAGLASSPDGTRLVVSGVFESDLLVYDLTPGSTYGQKLGQVDLGQAETFGVAFDPNDPTGHYAYVSMWGGSAVAEVDVSKPTTPTVARSFATKKDPEGIAFLDARWMAVADDLGDVISLVDRVGGTVTTVPVDAVADNHGFDVSGVAYDATNKRLYATLAGINAVGAWDVDTTMTPPAIVPSGRLPTAWWPGGVVTMADGSVIVASMREHGTGSSLVHWDVGDGDITDPMRGGVQRVASPSSAALSTGEMAVLANNAVSSQPGAPAVTCPAGVSDFPVPSTNTAGPSKVIQHVFLIVRENKDYDGLFGDFANANGESSLLLKTAAGQMDRIWTNLRALAHDFAFSDNYYTDAELSIQGHVWSTYGRTSDYDERTWAMDGDGRNARPVPGPGVFSVGQPVEGSLFDWLGANAVPYDILGEIVGGPQMSNGGVGGANPVDVRYPGGPFQTIGHADTEKACHIAARARVQCDFGSFVYATLPNDHTLGVSPTNASPETMCAVNDEATGMVVDAISHSPLWASSVIFITEDDPSQGSDHVDLHRAPLVVISPWVKRGSVSTTHTDVAAVHKLFAHIFGKPYPNVEVANASLPLELFTSTPDYTPYTYAPRTFPLVCGDASTKAEGELTASWDLDEPDEQPGLDAQVTRWMRGEQLEELPPRLRRQVEARILRRGVARTTRSGDARQPHDDGDDD